MQDVWLVYAAVCARRGVGKRVFRILRIRMGSDRIKLFFVRNSNATPKVHPTVSRECVT